VLNSGHHEGTWSIVKVPVAQLYDKSRWNVVNAVRDDVGQLEAFDMSCVGSPVARLTKPVGAELRLGPGG
jgi:hypothetical protein